VPIRLLDRAIYVIPRMARRSTTGAPFATFFTTHVASAESM
jgi:hypothetical protein